MKTQKLYELLNEALERRGWGPMSKKDFVVMISEKAIAGELILDKDEVFDLNMKGV